MVSLQLHLVVKQVPCEVKKGFSSKSSLQQTGLLELAASFCN